MVHGFGLQIAAATLGTTSPLSQLLRSLCERMKVCQCLEEIATNFAYVSPSINAHCLQEANQTPPTMEDRLHTYVIQLLEVNDLEVYNFDELEGLDDEPMCEHSDDSLGVEQSDDER